MQDDEGLAARNMSRSSDCFRFGYAKPCQRPGKAADRRANRYSRNGCGNRPDCQYRSEARNHQAAESGQDTAQGSGRCTEAGAHLTANIDGVIYFGSRVLGRIWTGDKGKISRLEACLCQLTIRFGSGSV